MAGESGQPESRGEKYRIFVVIAIVIVAIIVGLVYWQQGQAGLNAVVKSVIKWVLIAAVAGLIVYGVLWLMRKPKIDLVENDRRDIIDAGMMSKPPMVKDLYFTGDKEHGEFRVGTIIGYCQIQSYKDLDILAGLTAEQIDKLEGENKIPAEFIIKEDCFVFKRLPFPLNVFEEAKVLRTLEDEHSQLIGDVKVYGVSMIKKFGYYFPNRAHLDIARIDISVIREAWRGGIHQFLRDSVAINQRAIGLDSEHKKGLDERKLLKIPSPLGEDESRRG